MPQYKKVFDIGTYTGNGGEYRVGIPTLRGVGPSGFQDAGSLRFRQENSAYLSRTQGTPTNQQKMTFSFWMKKTSASGTRNILFTNDSGGAYGYFEIYSDNSLTCGDYGSGGYSSTFKFIDCSRWYHIVIAFDTTQASASNRMIVYIDNARDGGSYAGLTQNGNLNLGAAGYTSQICAFTRIGVYAGVYLSEFYRIDGQQLTPSSFAEYNSDGIWVPKAYSGTYGTTGFYLPMNNSSNYATDQSGNGNNWTPSVFNVTTSNTTYDLVTDSPTDYLSGTNNIGNYAILNRNQTTTSLMTLSAGNLSAAGASGSGYAVPGTVLMGSGKWYFEMTSGATASNYPAVGIQAFNTPFLTSGFPGYFSGYTGFGYGSNGAFYKNFSDITSGYGTFTTGDVIGVCVDIDAGKAWVSKNGTWLNSGDPAAGTNPAYTFTSGTAMYPCVGSYSSAGTHSMNFGQRAFTYTPPTGFKALNTYNYPRPADSSLWFYGDTPDLMWIKNRSTTGWHLLVDKVRGVGYQLSTNSTNGDSGGPSVTEMNKFGMSILNESGTFIGNGSTNSHVYWAWKAGSNTSSTSVTNTDGTITSQVSANRQAGFSIVSYTGTGANGTVGHGLGAAPSMIICKRRLTAGGDFQTYHISVGNTGTLKLNLTAATITSSVVWNNTSPTSSVFSLGSGGDANLSGDPFIAYCWAAIPGYSAFGSYTGNGSADGPFVYLSFRPRWIMWKRTDTISAWFMYDAVRQTYNVMGQEMYADTTSAEGPTTRMDFLSNGFKLRAANGGDNASGGTYIYMAMAEIPFKYARAR